VEGSSDAGKNDPELAGADRNLLGEIEDSPVEPDDTPEIEGATAPKPPVPIIPQNPREKAVCR